MSRTPLDRLRDRMLNAPNEIDDEHLPPRFNEARAVLADALAKMDSAGIPGETFVAVMLAEMLPRIVHQNGPAWASAMLAKLAHSIGGGASPAGSIQ